MTDKERLKEIEVKYSILTVSSEKNSTEYTEVDVEDLVFLIQNGFKQFERVQELGKLSDNLRHELFSVRIERDLLKEEVKALKKSVNFLEKQRERMGNNHQQTIKNAGLLLKQNQRYKQALKFYAEPENYCVRFEDDYEPILQDNGKTARQVIGWEEKNE